MNKILLFCVAVTLCFTAQAQVKVGNNPTTINANSVLEIESADQGVLIPRLLLTGTANVAPLAAHVAGMLVYNTATAGDVTPGFYYNDGAKWVRIATPHEWKDANDFGRNLIFANQAIDGDSIVIIDAGKMGIGTNNPKESLDIVGSFSNQYEYSAGGFGGLYSGDNGLGLANPVTAMFSTPNKLYNPATDPFIYSAVSPTDFSAGIQTNLAGTNSHSNELNIEKHGLHMEYEHRDGTGHKDTNVVINFSKDRGYIGHWYNNPVGGAEVSSTFNFKAASNSDDELHLRAYNEVDGRNSSLIFNTIENNAGEAPVRLVSRITETVSPYSEKDGV